MTNKEYKVFIRQFIERPRCITPEELAHLCVMKATVVVEAKIFIEQLEHLSIQ